MQERFRCEFLITKKHLSQVRRFTLLKKYRFEYVIYAFAAAIAVMILIRSFVTREILRLIFISVMVYMCLIRNFIRFIKMANSVAQKEVYAGEKCVGSGMILVYDEYITYFDNDNTSENIDLKSVKNLAITVDTFILYIDGHKRIIIPQYSFITGTKHEFVRFIEGRQIEITGKLYN